MIIWGVFVDLIKHNTVNSIHSCMGNQWRWQGLEWCYSLISVPVCAANEVDKDWSDTVLFLFLFEQSRKLTRTGVILSYFYSCMGNQWCWQGLEWYCLIFTPVWATSKVDMDWSDTDLFLFLFGQSRKLTRSRVILTCLLLCWQPLKLTRTQVIVLSYFCSCVGNQ